MCITLYRALHGELDMSEFPKAMEYLNKTFSDIVKISDLPRRDMVFIFNLTDIEKIFRTEGMWSSRTQVGSFVHNRKVIRKDFFLRNRRSTHVEESGTIEARSQVNPIMMQPCAVKRYTEAIDSVADH
ncbi:hypothetical protein B566_EDAN015992 [Ephemera danica]|nr:hypothetical protein B566_EDAN015992 [Ephemera danica]